MKDAWFKGWRVVGRLFLLGLASLVFWVPFNLLAELARHATGSKAVHLALAVVAIFLVMPFSAYYSAVWCREFRDELG